MVDGLGPFKDVKKLRNQKRADIVGLIIDNPNGCGLSTRVGPESDQAYFVAHHACARSHVDRARNRRTSWGSAMTASSTRRHPLLYGHGYVNGTNGET